MTAAEYNITIDIYSDFSRTFQVKTDDVVTDLTGYNFAASLRENYNSTNSVDFTTSIVDAEQGLFKITLTDTVTSDMSPGDWRYDIVMITPTNDRVRLIEGAATLKRGITR